MNERKFDPAHEGWDVSSCAGMLRSVLEGTTDAIFVKDLEGRYLMINSAGARFFELAPSDVIGKTDRELFDPQSAARIRADDDRVISAGRVLTYEDYACSAGRRHAFFSTKGPFRDGDGKIVGIVGISRDVTARKEIEQKLIRRGRQLEVLAEAAQRINSVLEVPAIMRSLLRSGIELVHARAGTWGLMSGDRLELHEYLGADGSASAIEGLALPQRVLNVPVYGRRHEYLGCIELHDKESDEGFDADDLAMLRALAAAAGVALQHARTLEELKAAEKRAREATAIRDEFLSIASHELKTPITTLALGIQSLLRLAERGELTQYPLEKLKLLLNIASDQNARLSRLVDDLLDTTRISAGRMLIRPAHGDLSDLVRRVLLQLAEPIRAAGCRLETRIEPGIEGHFDRTRIEQVLVNLLTNAMKYGPGKPVAVCLRREGEAALLSVQDYGIGIARESQDKIFSRFERAVSSRHFGGLGLGLYIVREILKCHDGSIAVESELNQGSLFTVKLPLRSERRAGETGFKPAHPGESSGDTKNAPIQDALH